MKDNAGKNILFLINHFPNPRIGKRIKILGAVHNVSLIYWHRLRKNETSYYGRINLEDEAAVYPVYLRAPYGNTALRFVLLFLFLVRALFTINREKPDIIHAGNFDMLFIAAVYRIFFDWETKLVYEVADLPRITFFRHKAGWKKVVFILYHMVEKKITHYISLIILTAPSFWNQYFSEFISEKKYFHFPNVPFRRVFEGYRNRPKNVFTIGYVGYLRYPRQLFTLIEVVKQLKGEARLFIAGNGPLRDEILNRIEDIDFIEYYGAYNYEEEAAILYSHIDSVYSVYDGQSENVRAAIPNKLYDAIVTELPIIVAEGTKLSDFVNKNGVGISINSESSAELRDALVKLSGDSGYVESIKKNCRRIKEQYYAENYIREFLKRYPI